MEYQNQEFIPRELFTNEFNKYMKYQDIISLFSTSIGMADNLNSNLFKTTFIYKYQFIYDKIKDYYTINDYRKSLYILDNFKITFHETKGRIIPFIKRIKIKYYDLAYLLFLEDMVQAYNQNYNNPKQSFIKYHQYKILEESLRSNNLITIKYMTDNFDLFMSRFYNLLLKSIEINNHVTEYLIDKYINETNKYINQVINNNDIMLFELYNNRNLTIYFLYHACYYNKPLLVEKMLNIIDINPSVFRNMCLNTACKMGYYNIVEILIKDSRVVYDPNDNEFHTFTYINVDNREVFKHMDDDFYGNKIFIENNNPIDIAVAYNQLDIVNILIKSGKFDSTTSIKYANTIDMVNLLLNEWNINPNVDDDYCLRTSAINNNIELFKVFNDHLMTDITCKNNQALRFAAEKGHHQIVELILTNISVNPSAENNYALYFSAEYGHIEVVKLLLSDPRLDINLRISTILKWTLKAEKYDNAKLILNDKRLDISKLTDEVLNLINKM